MADQLHKTARLKPASHLCGLGWEVTMVTSRVPEEEGDNHIRFIEMKWPPFYMLGALIYHAAIARRLLTGALKYDVVLFHENSALYLLPLALLLKLTPARRTRLVMDTRTMIMEHGSVRGKLRVLMFKLSHWMAGRLPLHQTAITPEMVRTVRIPARQLAGIWSSGVDPGDFEAAWAARVSSGPEGPVRLMYIGALHRERNLLATMEAVQAVRKDGINVSLEIVGDGMQREDLETAARRIGDMNIRVSAPVPRGQVPLVLARADVGILPFPDLEELRVSCAIKLFEYMAARMPLMASRIVAHTDVLGNADFVFWIDGECPEAIALGIRRIWDRRGDLGAMGESASDFVRSWTWEASARKLSDALNRVLEPSPELANWTLGASMVGVAKGPLKRHPAFGNVEFRSQYHP
ncbi:MAG: glycosyltransferase family 4 protein [Syntrophobacteraceae bacterium]|nr:glycosyltransferase family 4 protein [Syntrophobacteraceae bacterium]